MAKKKGKNTDTTCPRCKKKAYERGTLLVGAVDGGPIRFQYDRNQTIKVLSRACRSCGHVDFRIDPKRWESARLYAIERIIEDHCTSDQQFSDSDREGHPKSGTIQLPIDWLWNEEEGPARHIFDEMLEKYISEERVLARMCRCKLALSDNKKELIVDWRFSKKDYEKDYDDGFC